MSSGELWTYHAETSEASSMELTGFKVEATDGSIGRIDEATYAAGASYIVVDTGRWILGKKVMLPAGVIDRVDRADEKVYVNRTKDEIKSAPEFNADAYRESEYRDLLSSYYGPMAGL
ncbi:MAG TPA: hypothetical protein VNT03_08425 [Baekduia sp.]|nr:hypothetical protein [Baekduia sp.]